MKLINCWATFLPVKIHSSIWMHHSSVSIYNAVQEFRWKLFSQQPTAFRKPLLGSARFWVINYADNRLSRITALPGYWWTFSSRSFVSSLTIFPTHRRPALFTVSLADLVSTATRDRLALIGPWSAAVRSNHKKNSHLAARICIANLIRLNRLG